MKKKDKLTLIIVSLIVSIILLGIFLRRLVLNFDLKTALEHLKEGNYQEFLLYVKNPKHFNKLIYKLRKKCKKNFECANKKIDKNIIGWSIGLGLIIFIVLIILYSLIKHLFFY